MKNVGILFSASRKMGVFQYGLSIAEALINYYPENKYTILYFGEESPDRFLNIKNRENISFVSLDASRNNFLGKVKLFLNCILGSPIFVTNKKNKQIMDKEKLDLLIIPFQLMFGFENKVPYVVCIPDIMYKYYPNLPEYSLRNRILNNFVFRFSSKYSKVSVTDSEFGKNDLNRFFNIPKDKIFSIPFLPAGYIFTFKNMSMDEANEILKKYNLPEKFIFYPAQFWAHKNHINLIKAIKAAEEKFNQKVFLVLVGDDKANIENYNNIKKQIDDLNISDRVLHLGYVSDKEVVALYKKSLALVYSTLLGPTNIPPLEAMILGTPVICSDLFAMPEQIGGAGLLFNPFDPDDMAEKICRVWVDENLRKDMIEKGLIVAERISAENYARKWGEVVNVALNKK